MLVCRACGGEIVVDEGKAPAVVGNNLWFEVICIHGCSRGMLSNVESVGKYDFEYEDVKRKRYAECQKHQVG
jgi:hypothetical protein